MYVHWLAPFAWASFIGSVEADKATCGALSNAIESAHAAEIDRRFHFSERPNRLHPERFASHAEYLRNA